MMLYTPPDATTTIINVAIFIIIILGVIFGYKKGFTQGSITFLGFLIMFIGAYYLKNPISILLYKNFPFFNFAGPLKGITTLNILLYELIAYIIVLLLLFIVLRIITVFTKIIDKILSFILALGIPDSLLGAIIGFLEFYLVVYIGVFFLVYVSNLSGIKVEELGLAQAITKTPVLKETVGKPLNAFLDITEIINDSQIKETKVDYNYESLNILLKYNIITTDNAKELLINGKLTIPDSGKLISKYEKSKSKS